MEGGEKFLPRYFFDPYNPPQNFEEVISNPVLQSGNGIGEKFLR
jgi:hypothetical protein